MSLQQLKNQHPHDLFEVTAETDAKTLKRRFYRLLRQYPNETHPEEFIYLQETYETLVEQLASGSFNERERTPSYETYEYEEMEETQSRTRTRTPVEWSEDIEQLIRNFAYEEALVEARHMRETYPNDAFAFHSYLDALIEVGPVNSTYEEELDQLFQSILYQPRQLSSDYLFALLLYIELSHTLPSGEDGRLVALNQIEFMSVTADDASRVYEFLTNALRRSQLPEEVRRVFRRVAEIFERFDERFIPLGQTFYSYSDDTSHYERERSVEQEVYEEAWDTSNEQAVDEEEEYSFIGMVVFAIIVSAMFTPVVGIVAGIYIHIKRIPIWLYIFGLAIWGVIGIVTLMVLVAVFAFIFG